MLKGGSRGKVTADGVMLFVRRPLGQGPDDVLDIVSWKARDKISSALVWPQTRRGRPYLDSPCFWYMLMVEELSCAAC